MTSSWWVTMADPACTARKSLLIVGRTIILIVLIAGGVLFYMRVGKILEESFKDQQLKSADLPSKELPLAYRASSMESVIRSVVIERLATLIVVLIFSVMMVYSSGQKMWESAKNELGSYSDSVVGNVIVAECSMTERVQRQVEKKLCLIPVIVVAFWLAVSFLAYQHWIVGQNALALKCERCFTVACACDAPFLQHISQHETFNGERLPVEDWVVLDDSVQGRCETSGARSLDFPEGCTPAGSQEHQCPDVDAGTWRHDRLTSQKEDEYPIIVKVSEVLNVYELCPSIIIFVMLALATTIYLQKIKENSRSDLVELQDELFSRAPRSRCDFSHALCCCCLYGASPAQVLRIRIVLLALYLILECFTQAAGTEQHLCYARPLLFGSVDECSTGGHYSLIMASECKSVIFSSITLDLLSRYFRSIVVGLIILPYIVIPETITKTANHIWYRTSHKEQALEKMRCETVRVLRDRYDYAADKAEEEWDQYLKPLVEAFDPFYLSQVSSRAGQTVKAAMTQRLRHEFEIFLEESRSCPARDAEQYSQFWRIYLKAASDPEGALKELMENVVRDRSEAFTNLESKLQPHLPAAIHLPEPSLVGQPVKLNGSDQPQAGAGIWIAEEEPLPSTSPVSDKQHATILGWQGSPKSNQEAHNQEFPPRAGTWKAEEDHAAEGATPPSRAKKPLLFSAAIVVDGDQKHQPGASVFGTDDGPAPSPPKPSMVGQPMATNGIEQHALDFRGTWALGEEEAPIISPASKPTSPFLREPVSRKFHVFNLDRGKPRRDGAWAEDDERTLSSIPEPSLVPLKPLTLDFGDDDDELDAWGLAPSQSHPVAAESNTPLPLSPPAAAERATPFPLPTPVPLSGGTPVGEEEMPDKNHIAETSLNLVGCPVHMQLGEPPHQVVSQSAPGSVPSMSPEQTEEWAPGLDWTTSFQKQTSNKNSPNKNSPNKNLVWV